MLDIAAALYKLSLDEQMEKINRNVVFEEEVYEEKEKRSRRKNSFAAHGARRKNSRRDKFFDRAKKSKRKSRV